MHNSKHVIVLLYVFVMLVLAGATGMSLLQAHDFEMDLRKADQEWADAVARKDFNAYVSFLTSETEFVQDGRTLQLPQIKDSMEALFRNPEVSIYSQADKVIVSRTGDLGFVMGKFKFTKGPSRVCGVYIDTWTRTTENKWKVKWDISSAAPGSC